MGCLKNKKLRQNLEKIYDNINSEKDARLYKDTLEEACRFTPTNFFLIIIRNTLTRLGDALSNSKTVSAWLISYVNAPLYLISFIVPIRESGSLLPQIFIASFIRRLPLRKWIWIVGAVLQFISIAGIGIIALQYKGEQAGWFIILFVTGGISALASLFLPEAVIFVLSFFGIAGAFTSAQLPEVDN